MITIGVSEDLGSLTKETKEKKRSLETTCSILRHKLTITCMVYAIIAFQGYCVGAGTRFRNHIA